jgi:hypothetical protein
MNEIELQVLLMHTRQSVLFIGPQFSNLYSAVDALL